MYARPGIPCGFLKKLGRMGTTCSWLQAWYADFGSPSEFGKNVCQMAVEYVSERVVNITLGPEAFVNLTTSEHSGPMVRLPWVLTHIYFLDGIVSSQPHVKCLCVAVVALTKHFFEV